MVSNRRAHDPILNRAQIGQPEMLWSDDLVTVNLAGGAVLLDLGIWPPGRVTFCCNAMAAWL